MTCAWIETSSADTGSSATISRGSTASARAMPSAGAGRRRIRADSAARARAAGPTSSSSSPTRARRAASVLARPCSISGSPSMAPTVMRGLSEA